MYLDRMENMIEMVKIILLPKNVMIYVDGKRVNKCSLSSHAWKIKEETNNIHNISQHVKRWHTINIFFQIEIKNMLSHIIL